jgi:hypothetical protein
MNEISQLAPYIPLASQITSAAIAVKVFNSDHAKKLLGPLEDHYGNLLAGFAARGDKFIALNMGRILSIALHTKGKIQKGSFASPKIVGKIMYESMTSTDLITDLYLGRVLASSVSKNGRDDRGNVFAELIGRMSSYQLRAHYIFYHTIKDVYNGKKLNASSFHDRKKMHTFIPLKSFIEALDYKQGESENICCITHLTGHILPGLLKEDLIEDDFMFGQMHNEGHYYKELTSQGGVFTPTMFGMEFFAWVYGMPEIDFASFLSKDVIFEWDKSIKKPKGCHNVTDLITDKNIKPIPSSA